MKFLIAVVLTFASASALGSGPYLPSGWRPEGPAFFLPSEVQKPVEVSVKETLQETVASGSDSLREYGPPKLEVTISGSVQETASSDSLREFETSKVQEVSQFITNQGLPDVITEQTFTVVVEGTNANAEVNEVAAVEVVKVESGVNIEQRTVEEEVTAAAVIEEATTVAAIVEEIETTEVVATESDIISEERTTENAVVNENTEAIFEGRSLDSSITAEVAEQIVEEKSAVQTTESVEVENIVGAVQEVVEATAAALEVNVEKTENVVQLEVKTIDESVKNIEEALVNLEKEIKTEQIQSEIEIKTIQENSGTSVPEGFLEYGPPGFREYGPPKDDLLRPEIAQVSNDVSNTEARKRRFSPKFRPSKSEPKRGH